MSPQSQENSHGGITVVGIGPGPEEWVAPVAWQAIREAEVIAGGKRQLELYAPAGVEQIPIGADVKKLIRAIKRYHNKRIVVLASGDPGCFGILATLCRELKDVPVHAIPGISAMQLALARLCLPWEGITFASAHGRNIAGVVEAAWLHPKVLAFTDAQNTPQAVAKALLNEGMDYRMTVLERLGYPEERITSGTATEIAGGEFDGLAVVYIAWE